ncbi:terminase small subunit [Chitinophaga sp.]|uniref:terminase small subunit n=1 Tax=Chitinophaga sp. TaxID=1869181 RepID=UPI002CA8A55E|nr:terminase small subunit [Chitinophaga sp.]HWV64363.1 terminase small subunit [Chitinophaga sp.]
MGRKLKIPEPEEIQEKWEAFRKECDEGFHEEVASAGKVIKLRKRIVYTLERFQVKLKITRETWSKYKARARFADTIKRIEDEVFARKKEAMLNNEGSVAGLIFDMKANYGINDKVIIDAHIEGGFDVTLDLGGPAAGKTGGAVNAGG